MTTPSPGPAVSCADLDGDPILRVAADSPVEDAGATTPQAAAIVNRPRGGVRAGGGGSVGGGGRGGLENKQLLGHGAELLTELTSLVAPYLVSRAIMRRLELGE